MAEAAYAYGASTKQVAVVARLTYFSQSSARVAQLDRASASGAEGCGFDPRLAYQPSLGAERRAKAAAP